jgi:3',5'-cyclic AMP phosphodiesterase CpdA
MKLAWATDIHLDWLQPEQVAAFYDAIAASGAEAVLLTGDLAVARILEPLLVQLAERVARPVYLVLGNHDFWGSGTEAVWADMRALSERVPHLTWLGGVGPVPLTARTCVLGHDGWYDGRLGDYANSPIRLNDFRRMSDFSRRGEASILDVMQRLSAVGVEHVRAQLPAALVAYEHVVLLTHVPPFREVTRHLGQISGDAWLPFMSCRAMGDLLVEVMTAHPERRMTVLCGHTHSPWPADVLPNLRVQAGHAEYGAPALQPGLEVD